MPLLTSPIDGSPMQRLEYHGIEIDRCPATGGVWLDKGELEKLLSFVQQASVEDRNEYAAYRQQTPQDYRPRERPPQYHGKPYKYDDDYDDYYRHKHGRKSKMKGFFDLFD
jgi:uncharacterized protein